MDYKGSEILLRCLKEEGVDTIFGYPGGAVIPLYDTLYDQSNQFMHFRAAHEQGAVHAADGYARTTGKVGVCFATSGPGATNTITGIATAFMDSVPMIVITGQVPSVLLGKDSFQEIDITGLTFPITKHNYIVKDVKNLRKTVKEAINIAVSGRPGPVLIDIPKDVFIKTVEDTEADLNTYDFERFTELDESVLKAAAERINKAKKPVIYAGGGVVLGDAVEQLRRLAEKSDIPVVNTLMGLGNFPRSHELSLGMVGMHGFPEANMAITDSDLVIAIGARFSDRVIGRPEKFAVNSDIIHIDVDATEINKNINAQISLLGDVKHTLSTLLNHVEERKNQFWFEQIYSYAMKEKRAGFTPENILKKVNQAMEPDTIVATDVGQHQMWTAQYWSFENPRSFVTSGGLGTMGFGLGAAIGAQVGNPDKRVLLVTGDGSFRMNSNELATVASYNIPVVVLLMNNSTLGMVRQWQKMFQQEKYSETCIGNEVDYIKLAEAYSLSAHKATNLEELDEILQTKLVKGKPVFIECKIDKDENVIPIVPPGKPIDEFLLG